MDYELPFSQFLAEFSDDKSCLEKIKKMRFPKGIHCYQCKKITIHYKLRGRTAYSCKYCRNQIFPLAGTIFDKTTTPLRLWFYAMFLMTHTQANISAKQLQRELGVTYKTAWRIYKRLHTLMAQNNGDLLSEAYRERLGLRSVRRWTFFNKLEITVVQKEETNE